ncbi:MAG: hypothetical protein UT82_C0018G0008 [Parcubacteria group bacterium GW2011_GWB1_40_14]|nr:MAG: hypothetical protein UT82_C0018G0008 [Parcubacteria group bacterium GW2011_GWB1_40_14]
MNVVSSLIFRLNLRDVVKGLAVAVIVVILGALQEAFGQHGLDITSFDWQNILDVAWKAALAYLGKNFLSDEKGKVLGRIG